MTDSYFGVIVEYGSSQRPKMARRLNCLRCMSRYFSAYLRQALRTDMAGMSSFLRPRASSTLISMGRPWQSHPGTYGESNPAMVFDFTTKSFKHLLSACPRWMGPLAYGGPSCSTYSGAPLRAARIFSYRPRLSHFSSHLGSLAGRLAFMEKLVLGRLSVLLSSEAPAIPSPLCEGKRQL